MMVHLAAFAGWVFVGVGFVLGPVLVWVIKKEDFPAIDAHFKEAINFQISLLIYSLIAILIMVVTLGVGFVVAVPALAVIALLDVLFPIIAAIQAYEGNLFRYPLSLRLVK